jgi:hypothetical protein
MSAPASGSPTPPASLSFSADIRPLFRQKDRDSMLRAFDLWLYNDVVTHAAAIATQLRGGTMPCDGAWPADRVELFDRWVDAGTPE